MEAAVSLAAGFSYHLSECVLQGFATSHAAQIEPGEGESPARLEAVENKTILLVCSSLDVLRYHKPLVISHTSLSAFLCQSSYANL